MKNIIYCSIATIFLAISSLHSQSNQNWLNSGDISLRQTNIQKALKNYNLHIENNPRDPLGYIQRAKLYEAIGRRSESKADLNIAQQLNPMALMHVSPNLRTKYAAKKSYAFNYENLDAAFVKSPSRYEDYKKIMDKLAIDHSQDSIIQSVIVELNDKNISSALELLASIEITKTNEALVYDLYGKVYLKKMDYSTAINYFTKAIKSNPNFSIPYHNRSVCHKLTGNFVAAESDLKTAISLNDNIALFYFSIAKLNEMKGNDTIALENYSKAIEIDGDYQEAMTNYSQLLKGLGEYDLAIDILNEAIDANPAAPENKFFRANLHFTYGSYEDALSEYKNYLRLYPRDSDAKYNLGLTKILMRNTEEGCIDIQNSIELKSSEKRQKVFSLFCNNEIY